MFRVSIEGEQHTINYGDLVRLPLETGQTKSAEIVPLQRRLNFGPGYGKPFTATVFGGPAGIILDGRGRSLEVPTDAAAREKMVLSWYDAFSLEAV